jgi:hypothetical protein
MRREARLRQIENELGSRSPCLCGPRGTRGSRVWFPVDRESGQPQLEPSSICDKCGGQMVIIKVVYEEPVNLYGAVNEIA